MRNTLIGLATAVLLAGLAGTTPSQAAVHPVVHPWCYDGTGNASGVPICGYDSYQQCVANAAGQCIMNPNIVWPTDPRPPVYGWAPRY